jgi:phosphatidylinositol-3-phosphatase
LKPTRTFSTPAHRRTPSSETTSCKSRALLLFSLALLGILSSAETITVTVHTTHGASEAFDYVTIILMENNGLCDILTTNPGGCSGTGSGTYMTSLASTYGLATHDTAITHPSEPNYIALTSGSTSGITSDGNCCFQLSGSNIIDRIEASGRMWKAFAEDATNSGTCSFTPPRIADHFPFLEFRDMNTASRCSNFLSATSPNDQEFISVLNGSNPPNFLWLTPNDQDNMHSSSVSVGDSYLAGLVPQILNSSTFKTKNAALFIVFDEGSDSCPSSPSGDCVYTMWAGPVAKQAFTSNAQYNHYSFLKTLESIWGLSSLTSNDSGASPMTEFFQANSQPSGPSSNPLSNSFGSDWFWFALPIIAVAALGLVLMLAIRSRRERTHATVQH